MARLRFDGFFALFAALALAACTEPNPGYLPPSGADGGYRVDGSRVDWGIKPPPPKRCTPNTFIECVGPLGIRTCRKDGDGTEVESCAPFRCNPLRKRCDTCDVYAPPRCEGKSLVTCADGVPSKRDCGDAGCQNGQCKSGCTPRVFYRDNDGDGFGDHNRQRVECEKPGGYVEDKRDCDDDDKDARPGQGAFFDQRTNGTKTFDYNCDGAATRRYPHQANCRMSNGKCVGEGWYGPIPGCGNSGLFAKCEKRQYGGCVPSGVSGRRQTCH